jgi:hypothetical protein
MNFKLSLAAVLAAFCMVSSANAATCSIRNVYFTLTGSSNATCVAGDDLGNHGITAQNLELFDLANWTVGDSTEPGVGDGSILFDIAGVSSGRWAAFPNNTASALMIVLKSGHQWGAFLLDGVESYLTGTWNIQRERCNKNGCVMIGKPLSHASVYYNEPAAVPLPAAGLMLLAGLGGLAALRRKRSAA